MNSPDPDFVKAADDFKQGGWIVALLGVAGALLRLLISEERYNWVCWAKKLIAGGLVGILLYFALHGTGIDPLYKSIILSSGGAISPQLFQLIEDKIKKYIKRQ
jgi:hypothetical protein